MKNAPHPGFLIRTEIIDPLGLTVSKAAEILQVRRATLSDVLHGKAALTPEMALRIEKAFGPDMRHLLRMQLAFDVARVRRHSRTLAVKRYKQAAEVNAAEGIRQGLEDAKRGRGRPAREVFDSIRAKYGIPRRVGQFESGKTR